MDNREIEMHLLNDLCEMRKNQIQAMGVQEDADADPIMDYLILMKRRIPKHPRNIYKAIGFSCPDGYEQKLSYLEDRIKAGDDLNPFLTRTIKHLKSKDLMLYDWNIFHFHITDEMDSSKGDGFMKRSAWLLMAWVGENDMYFIKTMPHNTPAPELWAQQDYLQTIKENWPDLLAPYELKDVVLSEKFTNEDIYNLRKKNVVPLVGFNDGNVGGLFGEGYTLSGIPLDIVDQKNDLIDKVKVTENMISEHFWNLIKQEPELYGRLTKETQVALKLIEADGDRFVVEEPNLNAVVIVEFRGDSCELEIKNQDEIY